MQIDLIEDLDLVDWPESLKSLQINWIGKSEGAQVHFPVEDQSTKKLPSLRLDPILFLAQLIWC